MVDEQWPCCATLGVRDHAIVLVRLSTDIMEISGPDLWFLVKVAWERWTYNMDVWGICGGGLMKAVGMHQECGMGLFKRQPTQQGQMWPQGKLWDPHSNACFSPFPFQKTHIHTEPHTFQWNILSCMTTMGRCFKGEISPLNICESQSSSLLLVVHLK